MAMATNALFVKNWPITVGGGICTILFGGILIKRSFRVKNVKPGKTVEA
jgi:hypothetical protein